MQEAIEKARTLIEALPYIQSFDKKVVVIKFGGAAMDPSGDLSNILLSVVFMSQVGMRPVLVHGGGPAISREMTSRGIKPEFVEGHRVTDEATIAVVEDVLKTVNDHVVSEVERLGGRARGIHVRRTKALHGERIGLHVEGKTEPVSIGLVGRVTKVDVDKIRRLCSRGVVPVIAPLAVGEGGEILNVNADTAATAIAAQLNAEKFVLVTDVPGILRDKDDPASLYSTLTEDQLNVLIERGVVSGGMLPKVRACVDAIDNGVGKAHIIDGALPHSLLLEMFTDEGVGTQIVKENS